MKQLHWNRLLLGGLVARLIIDVVQWLLNGVLLGSEWRDAMQALGKPLEENPARSMFYILLGLVYGVLAVWFYASIRPRYGAGPVTALYAGAAVWLLGYCLPTLTWMPMGLFPAGLVSIAMLIGLVELVAATEVGAWLYQEPLPGSAEAARRAA